MPLGYDIRGVGTRVALCAACMAPMAFHHHGDALEPRAQHEHVENHAIRPWAEAEHVIVSQVTSSVVRPDPVTITATVPAPRVISW